jgi:hypothetical protein
MNQIVLPRVVLAVDRKRIAVAYDVTNPDEFEDDLEKYEYLEELTELFFAAKRHHPNVAARARSLDSNSEIQVRSGSHPSLRNWDCAD